MSSKGATPQSRRMKAALCHQLHSPACLFQIVVCLQAHPELLRCPKVLREPQTQTGVRPRFPISTSENGGLSPIVMRRGNAKAEGGRRKEEGLSEG